jgi:hypothetical protein
MKFRTLTCITAMVVFVVLTIPVGLTAQEKPPAPSQDGQSLQVGGTGTTNYVPIWTNSTTLGNSLFLLDQRKVGLSTTRPTGHIRELRGFFVRPES